MRNVDDVLSELGPLPVPSTQSASVTIHSPRELGLTLQETEVLNQINSQPTGVDEILRACNLESSRVLATLTVLEMPPDPPLARKFLRPSRLKSEVYRQLAP